MHFFNKGKLRAKVCAGAAIVVALQLAAAPAWASTPYTDTTQANFASGTNSGTAVTNAAGGEVVPLSAGSTDFPSTSLPSDWESYSYGTGSSAAISAGTLTLDGSRAGASEFFGPGQTLTFTATFTGAAYQHGGFGTDYASVTPTAIFTTSSGGALYAGVDGTNVSLGTTYLNSSRSFTIAWNYDNVVFSVGTTVVATITTSENSNMRPLFADASVGGGTLKVSKVHVAGTPDVSPTFTSFPTGWTHTAWGTGSTATASGGTLTLNGAWAAPTRSYTPGHTLQYQAKFTTDNWQEAGWVGDWGGSNPELGFDTETSGTLVAVADGVTQDLGTTYLGAFHTYTIDWQAEHVVFSVDGTQVASLTPSVADAANLRPNFSDLSTAGNSLLIKSPVVTSYTPVNASSFSSLPDRWGTDTVDIGGSATTSGGVLHVDGAVAGSYVWARGGTTLQFVATFKNGAYEQGGFGTDLLGGDDAVTFQVGSGGTTFAATAGSSYVTLSSSYLGSSHAYKIVWNGEDYIYFIDGSQVASIAGVDHNNLRPVFGDPNTGGDVLDVSSVSMSASVSGPVGTFTSRVIDSTTTSTVWGAISWNAVVPTGAGLTVSVRSGNTATPDGTWTAWTPITASGNSAGISGRYIQYTAQLTAPSTVPSTDFAPVLNDVTLVAGP